MWLPHCDTHATATHTAACLHGLTWRATSVHGHMWRAYMPIQAKVRIHPQVAVAVCGTHVAVSHMCPHTATCVWLCTLLSHLTVCGHSHMWQTSAYTHMWPWLYADTATSADTATFVHSHMSQSVHSHMYTGTQQCAQPQAQSTHLIPQPQSTQPEAPNDFLSLFGPYTNIGTGWPRP